MRIVNPGQGLIAAVAILALQAMSPAQGQYSSYSQQPSQAPVAQPAYGQPTQQPQQTFTRSAAQAPPVQHGYPQYTAQSAPPTQYSAYAPPAQPQFGFTQPAQQRPAQPAYAAPTSTEPVYQVAQKSVVQTGAPQPSAWPQTAAQQTYIPQQGAQPTPTASAYSQYAPAQGYNAALPPSSANRYATTPAATVPSAASTQGYSQAAPAYSTPYAQPRVAMAFQAQSVDNSDLQLTPRAEEIAPSTDIHGDPAAPVVPADAYPAMDPNAQGPNGAAPNADGNYPPGGYESYPPYDNNGAPYGACNTYSTYGHDQPGRMARLLGRHGQGYWFGGVYGLVMDRDSSHAYPLTFAAAGMAPGDYPMPSDVVLTTRDVESDFQGGVEFRLGRTFGGFAADPCGYGCGGGPKWGIEGVYWELFEDNEYVQFVDSSVRTYSMMPMRGLQYDPGSGNLPVNEFWDYAPPVAASTIDVRWTRSRSSFEVRNFELNLLRLSICGDACAGPAMCNVGCESGSCDTCSTGECSTGQCDASGYGYGIGRGGLASRFSCTGVCGVRYLELDESFMYGVNYYDTVNTTDGFLDYWANTENRLVGFQLGCNGMYRIGCKWGLHMNTLVGLYGNDIDVQQYFVHPQGGMVTYTTGEEFDVNASKTDVSMLGELRLGASYQATNHCRVYGGWRAMGITGVALATNQTPVAFLDATQMGSYVNSSGSMILHGLQTGVEWNY